MADGTIGILSTIERSTDDVTYVALADIISFTTPNTTRDMAETTELADTWKTQIPARLNPGEASFVCTYDYTSFAIQHADMVAGTLLYYRMDHEFTTEVRHSFTAYVTGVEISEANGNDVLQYTVTLTITDAVTLAQV